ncbi:MAG: DUF2306 domain-containing protein [Pseudomonadota bacterium]
MSATAMSMDEQRKTVPDFALDVAAGLWFVSMLAGQAVFLYYILAFYAQPTLTGNFAAWGANPFLEKGFIDGDASGNLAFAAHVMVAALVTFFGMLQLVPQIRARALPFHRWNGRIFLTAAMIASLSGFYMVWARGEIGDMTNALAISLNGALIVTFAALALKTVLARDIDSHRRWAMRTLLAANGVFFLRLGVFSFIVITQQNISAFQFHIFQFASFLLPLAVLELYFRARANGALAKLSMAIGLVGCAAYTGAGIVGFVMIFVKMVLGAAPA